MIEKSNYYIKLYENYRGPELDKTYLKDNKDIVYNLYFRNCDTVVGEILSLVDHDFVINQWDMLKTTPNNTYFVKEQMLDNSWDKMQIGENSTSGWLNSIPGLYYIMYIGVKEKQKNQLFYKASCIL